MYIKKIFLIKNKKIKDARPKQLPLESCLRSWYLENLISVNPLGYDYSEI